LDDYARQARDEIARLPRCSAREALSSLVDYVVARTR
jgi:heptaprenyl diphosphate synthase